MITAKRLHQYEISARIGDEWKIQVVAASSRKAAERVAEWIRTSGEFAKVTPVSVPGAGWRPTRAMFPRFACVQLEG